jgi:hypothetical protein
MAFHLFLTIEFYTYFVQKVMPHNFFLLNSKLMAFVLI